MATRIQLEGIVLSEESKAEKDECSVISMICQVSKTWTQSTMVVVRGWGVGKMGKLWSKNKLQL